MGFGVDGGFLHGFCVHWSFLNGVWALGGGGVLNGFWVYRTFFNGFWVHESFPNGFWVQRNFPDGVWAPREFSQRLLCL